MFGSAILDVAIGLTLIYLFVSLICTVIGEWISQIRNMRAKELASGIRNLLNDKQGNGLTKIFYEHPLIKGLSKEGKMPSYIPPRTFALALIDIIPTGDSIKASIDKIGNDDLKKTLLIHYNAAGHDINKTIAGIEKWFNDATDRISGWYKKKAQWIILICALMVSLALNADTIEITNSLYRDATLRSGLVAVAEVIAKQPSIDNQADSQKKVELINEKIMELNMPLFWPQKAVNENTLDWICRIISISKIAGLILTSLAASLGAPFWFDILSKFINIRSTGKKPGMAK